MLREYDLKKFTVLVVEDDPATRLILSEAVRHIATVISAQTGVEALEIIHDKKPQIVLLDIGLPDMSGIDVCRHINLSTTQRPSIIFVTASESPETEREALEAGGIDFLAKPVNLATCQLRVKNHLYMHAQAEQLYLAEKDLASIISSLPVHVSLWSTEWHNLYSNDFDGRWFAAPPKDTHGCTIDSMMPAPLVLKIMQARDTDTTQEAYFVVKGKERYVQINLTRRHYNGLDQGYLLTLLDITSIKNTERSLRREKERIRVTLNSIGDGVIATDLQGMVTFMNPIAERMTGYTQRDAKGLAIEDIMDLRDATTQVPSINPARTALNEKRIVAMALNCQLRSAQGTIYRVEDSASPIRDEQGEIIGAIIVFHDVSESVAMAVKMSHLANHDQLTDLPNRILLQDRLERALRIAQDEGHKCAVFLIDLDNFKILNDSLGPSVGDRLIKLVAERLKRLMRPDYTLARTGGDEFVVVAPRLYRPEEITKLAEQLNLAIEHPINLNGSVYNMSGSIGISACPTDGYSLEELMRKADVAMYRAKQEGRNRYCFFSTSFEERIHTRHALNQLLKRTIDSHWVEVHYQPKVRLDDQTIIDTEALMRLRDEDGNMISPAEFIPFAEEMGHIVRLGRHVLYQACKDAANWQTIAPNVGVAVNIAASQFTDLNFFDDVRNALTQSGLRPNLLEVEITESALMHDVGRTQAMLNQLREIGVKISIDDFGTGYSSLAYLQKFQVDVLKIDQSFIKALLTDSGSYDIVKTIIALGKSLNLQLCSEGIETQEQLTLLKQLQCETGQGFYFSKPVALNSLHKLLKQGSTANRFMA